MSIDLHIEPHPDELLNKRQAYEMKRGSRQAAEDAAIEAYIKATDEGKSRKEAEQIHSETYIKFLRP